MITFPTPFQPVPFLALPQKEIKNGLSFSGAFALPPPLAARYYLCRLVQCSPETGASSLAYVHGRKTLGCEVPSGSDLCVSSDRLIVVDFCMLCISFRIRT